MKYFLAAVTAAFGIFFYQQFQLVMSEPINSWSKTHVADCGVVLTGGPGRVREGIDLLFRKQIKKLIISGVNPRAQLYEIFPQWPYYHGLDSNDVVLERYSGTTYGNARQTLPLVEASRCQSVVLVTSRLHMYRAKKTFWAIYPEDIEIFTRSIGEQDRSTASWVVLSEVIKSLFYSVWAY